MWDKKLKNQTIKKKLSRWMTVVCSFLLAVGLRNKVEWMGNLIFSDMFPQSDEWRRLNNMCGSIIYVGTSTSTCFRKRSRLRKS